MMKYLKLVAAVVAAGLVAAVAALTGDETISNTEWINIAIAVVNAGTVFAAPNVPGAMYTKTIVAVLSAILAAMVSFITDGISSGELMQLIVIGLGAAGVYAVPNSTKDVGAPTTFSAR